MDNGVEAASDQVDLAAASAAEADNDHAAAVDQDVPPASVQTSKSAPTILHRTQRDQPTANLPTHRSLAVPAAVHLALRATAARSDQTPNAGGGGVVADETVAAAVVAVRVDLAVTKKTATLAEHHHQVVRRQAAEHRRVATESNS